MRKFKQIFLAALLVLILAVGFAACSDGGADGNKSYTVTVTCVDSATLTAVKVRLTDAEGKTAGEKALTVGSDKTRGTASFDLPAGEYSVSVVETLDGVLADYSFSVVTLTAETTAGTIAIEPTDSLFDGETVRYVLVVKKPDGTPVADLSVQLCGGPVYRCNSRITDATGTATFDLPAGDYEVHIAEHYWPAGLKFDDTKFKIGPEGGTVTASFETA